MSLSRLRESLASATPAYLALSCFGLASTPALAQEPANTEKPAQLGGVTVSDTAIDDTIKADAVSSPKFTQPIKDTPQTIQVIRKELFNQQGATTLTEALRNSPGTGTFYAGENGNTTTGDAVYMRGFDTSNSIFVDGLRDLGTISRDIFNTDQIEVARGPAGTDYGRTAPTGAINMVSKLASLDTAVSGTASVGVDGQKRATADFNQVIGAIPNAAVRLNLLWQDSDNPARDHVKDKRFGIAPSFGFGLGTQTRLFLNFLHVDQENVPDGFVPTIGLPGWTPQDGQEALAGHPVDPSNFYGTRDDHDDVTAQMATIKFEHDFSDNLRLTNVARWGKTRQDYLLSSFMTTSANVTATDPADLSTYTLVRSNTTLKDVTNEILTDQLNLRADFATGGIEHNLTAGFEIAREKQITYAQAASGTRPAASLYDPDWNDTGSISVSHTGAIARGKTDTEAFYLFDTAKFFDGAFLVTGGVRFDHYKTTYFSTAVCNDGTGRGAVSCDGAPVGTIVETADLAVKDWLFNWKLGAVYKPAEAVSLYVNYALSQQPPGGTNFTLSNSETNANNPNLKPQKASTIEAGAKWSALNDALLLTATVFRTKVENEINTATPEDIQSGSKRVQGVEISAVGNITEAWSVSAGYSHLDTKVTEGPAVTSDGTSNLTYIPGDSWTIWTNYSFPFGLELAGGARHNDGLHRGTDSAVGTPATTKGYTVADGMIAYALTGNVKLRVNAYNLFDKEYVAAINKSGYRYTPGTPRTFLFSADFRF